MASDSSALQRLVEETLQVADVLVSDVQRESVRKWVGELRDLVLGENKFRDPDALGLLFVQELQNVLPFLPNQLGALFSQVLKETLEEVLNEASSGEGGEKARKGEGWVACAKRIVGGAFNALAYGNLSQKGLESTIPLLYPTLHEVLFGARFVDLRELQVACLEVVDAGLHELEDKRKVIRSLRDGRLTSERMGELLFRFKTDYAPLSLALDVAAPLLPGRRQPVERVEYIEGVFALFGRMKRKARDEWLQAKGGDWTDVTKRRTIEILSKEGLDRVHLVPLFELSSVTLDGGPRTYLQTDDERRAVEEGRMVAFIDEGRLGVECEVHPGEFGTFTTPFADITGLTVEEIGEEDDAMSTAKFDCITGSATFKFGISYGALFKVLQARKISCDIPPPAEHALPSSRAGKTRSDVLLPDPGLQVLERARAEEEKIVSQGRSKETEERVAVMAELAAPSGSSNDSNVDKSPTHPVLPPAVTSRAAPQVPVPALSTSFVNLPARTKKTPTADRAPSRPKALSVATPAPRRSESTNRVKITVSNLGSELSDLPDEQPTSGKRKRSSKSTRDASEEEEEEEEDVTLIVESGQTSPNRKRSKSVEIEDADEADHQAETLEPTKKQKAGARYSRKSKLSSKPSSRSTETTASTTRGLSARPAKPSRASDKTRTSVDVELDEWDDLPGGGHGPEMAQSTDKTTKTRPKPKARLKKFSSSPPAEKRVKPLASQSKKKGGGGSSRATTPVAGRRSTRSAAVEASKKLASEASQSSSEDIDDFSQSQRVEADHSEIENEEEHGWEKAKKLTKNTRTAALGKTTEGEGEGEWEKAKRLATSKRMAEAAVHSPPATATRTVISESPEEGHGGDMEEEVDQDQNRQHAQVLAPETQNGDGSSNSPTVVSEGNDDYGGGMDYQPEDPFVGVPASPATLATLPTHATASDSLEQIKSLSDCLGGPRVPMTGVEEQDSVVLSDGALAQSLGFVTPLHRSNLKSPSPLFIHRDSPGVSVPPSQVKAQPNLLRGVEINAPAQERVKQSKDASRSEQKLKSNLTPWKVQADKLARAQEEAAREAQDRLEKKMAAENLHFMDVFEEEPQQTAFGQHALHDAHSTPRPSRHLGLADRSFSVPLADYPHAALEGQPASEGSVCPTSASLGDPAKRPPRRPKELRQAPSDVVPPAPEGERSTSKNVRILLQAEVIPRLTADSNPTSIHVNSGQQTQSSTTSGTEEHASSVPVSAGPKTKSTDARGRASAASADSTRSVERDQREQLPKSKTVPSPRSAGLTGKDKRHPSHPRRPSSGRAGDPPAARTLKKLLDDLNEELYKKCVRRINSTQNGAKDAGTKYLKALQAVHQRFADETMQILEDNEDVDERAMKELEAIARDFSDLRRDSKLCLNELAKIKKEYLASYGASESALMTALANLNLRDG